MKKIVIIKTGDTFPDISAHLGDFEDWIFQGLGVGKEMIRVVDVVRNAPLPSVDSCRGVVIAGSHAMVTEDLAWSVAVERWIPDLILSCTPLLGICYGHQLLAKAMGGVVDYHARGIEIGTTLIDRVTKDGSDSLFKGLPKHFTAHVCHSQTVVKLPDTAVRLAKNAFEPNHAFRIGPCAWGVQFHPEYDERIMAAYVKNMAAGIQTSGQVLSEVLDKIEPSPAALSILQRFGKQVG